jgi:hypothetical protein
MVESMPLEGVAKVVTIWGGLGNEAGIVDDVVLLRPLSTRLDLRGYVKGRISVLLLGSLSGVK